MVNDFIVIGLYRQTVIALLVVDTLDGRQL